DPAGVDQGDQGRDPVRGDGARDLGPPFFELAQDLPLDEVGDPADVTGRAWEGGGRGLEVVGELAGGGERPRVLGGQAVLGGKTRAPDPWQLGQAGADLRHTLGGDDERRQVRLREVAVVVRLLLAPQEAG